ncbi:bifunctional hydroxymethylpyrimidine kinase/phosphomethylpyrimidine kinase [Ornithinimicrobium sufpigmenti]|uniref:bifunctional hydroxymethylpyrimidine kinase/phosphomethylpyrimidine kinase n=1 Tax=Ornithinimicrobium sufpigmenti TaxID=2508882 RepID=UPI001EDFB725|nr:MULTISPECIES: bifunctional hydroxymethylpyrimidine kinase/phosphomethylpyrimidine kinase [unclassified Ornithinimicrobium]
MTSQVSPARGLVPNVLSVAGSDPSGGAGIQADLKTFGALGAHGCAVLTALTAQSTLGVTGVRPIPAEFVREQVETLVADVALAAVKVGMLGSADVVRAVRELAQEGLLPGLVLDPVMVSTAGSRLLDEDAVEELRALAPHADLITPNLPEAAVLLGRDPEDTADGPARMLEEAHALLELGSPRVLLKGGHASGDHVLDLLVDADGVHELGGPRVATPHTHGTGCSLSSAIAALRPRRDSWLDAVADARSWLVGALAHGHELSVGQGPGPVHHFWQLWQR